MRGWIVRDDLDKCIEYTQRVRVYLGIGRGIRRWVRIRASVPGAYLRSGYRLGKFRLVGR